MIMKLSHPAFLRATTLLAAFASAPFLASAAPANVTVSAPNVNLANTWLLDTDPANDTVRFSVDVSLSRNQPLGGVRDIPVTFRTRLRAVGTTTSLGSADQTVVVTVDPVVANLPLAVNLAIDPTVILSEDIPCELVISVLHNDDPPGGVPTTDHSITHGPHSFAHFSGALVINGQTATINSFSSAPIQLPADQAWRLRVQSGMLADGTPFTGGAPATATIDVLRNDTTGAATLTAGTLNLAPPGGPIDVNGWQVALGPIVFGNGGRQAQGFTLRLPPGTGWRLHDTDPNTSQLLTTTFGSATALLLLDESNQPIAGASGNLTTPHEFVDERAAVGFVASAWQWDLFHLRLTQPATRFLRAWYFEQWKDPQVKGELPDSNDGFWDQLNASTSGDLLIAPGMTGGFNATLTFANGVFSTHFPHGFVAHTGGSLQLVNGLPTPAASSFPLATVTMITYRGCRPEDQPHVVPDPSLLEAFQVGPVPLRFTAHGSLWTEGLPVSDPNPLDTFIITRRAAAGTDPDSGLPVHQTGSYLANNIQLFVPGPVVAAADGFDQSGDGNATVDEPGEHPEEFNPARWLLTGLRPAEGDALEHPGTPAYLLGEGDYAGANFRGYAGLAGISRVGGGVLGPYQLELCQKLYARASGVSGRWVADADSLPPSVQIGGDEGFALQIEDWAFQLVGNEPQFEHSAVTGSLAVPHPADFTLAFDELEFECCGAIDRMSVAGGDSVKQLAYWQQARIDIQSARFITPAECATEPLALELGVLARANGFPEDLDGILRFRGNGRMTTGTDSTFAASVLHVPNVSPFAGDYRVTGVGHAYYNDPPNPPSEDNGWINFAGLLVVPFFENMEIHALLLGTDLPGGLNPDVILGMQGGWSADGETYFSNAGFDAGHRGLPPAFNAPLSYLGSQDEAYLPRAEKTWFGLIPFNFPVQYSPL
ncbi:MAG TPA: hypothetical protein DCY13_14055, partial [Verrucomicrobiales bacterium]|nr:hypothetical protein [Verrucomicrobiales bacterium]